MPADELGMVRQGLRRPLNYCPLRAADVSQDRPLREGRADGLHQVLHGHYRSGKHHNVSTLDRRLHTALNLVEGATLLGPISGGTVVIRSHQFQVAEVRLSQGECQRRTNQAGADNSYLGQGSLLLSLSQGLPVEFAARAEQHSRDILQHTAGANIQELPLDIVGGAVDRPGQGERP